MKVIHGVLGPPDGLQLQAFFLLLPLALLSEETGTSKEDRAGNKPEHENSHFESKPSLSERVAVTIVLSSRDHSVLVDCVDDHNKVEGDSEDLCNQSV